MALTTFSELKTAIATLLNRDDLTTAIPDFITLCEAQVQRDVRHYDMEKRATASVTGQYTAVPSDMLQPIRFHIDGKYRALDVMSSNEMADRRAATENAAGEPLFYCITGGEIELFPTPGDTYTLELHYYRTIEALSDSNTSNWLLARGPDVYLYGSALHSAPYLVNDERLPVWQALYAQGVAGLNAESDKAKFPANLRIRAS